MAIRKTRHEKRPLDTASVGWKNVLFGGGAFDTTGEHPNQKGWDIFELGQKSFWAVPTALEWDQPVREHPDYARHIAAMLSFLCPGEKMAVTGASYISTLVRSEEAKFYFAEQALEEAKHYDALRRLVPKITGRPLAPPSPWVRLLYSYGVIDAEDPAFMMGSINIIGEHLANQIFHKINHVAKDPSVRSILALIGRIDDIDVVTGSAATLTSNNGTWEVREGGPVPLWERIERVLSAYDEAGRPGPETFTLHVYDGGQHLRHPHLPGLPLPRP